MSEKEFLINIGNRIREARKQKGWTLKKLEEITGIHYSSLPEIENGKRDCHILTLKKIAEALDLEVKDCV